MNIKQSTFKVLLVFVICFSNFGSVLAQNGTPQSVYLVAIGATSSSEGVLEEMGIPFRLTSAGQYIASVTASQLAELRSRGLEVEVLKSNELNTDLAVAQSGSLSNEYLTLSVIDSGQFTLQTAGGKYLLYPYGNTSYLSVNVNNQVYDNENGTLTVVTPFTVVSLTSGYIQYQTPENILITQRYTLNGPAVSLQVEADNQGVSPHSVSVRYLLDTQVDVNDGSPLYAVNVGVRTYETDLPTPSFSSWQGYDIWPDPSLTSVGTFSTQPNRVVFAWWPNAFGYPWDYTPNPDQAFYTPGYTYSPYSDSCVLLYFNMGVLPGGSQHTIMTYYGTGSPTISSKRDQLISAFYQFKEAVKSSITADVSAYAALQAKYYVSLRPTLKDYVQVAWTLAAPDPNKLARLGKDAQTLSKLVDVIGKVGVANTFFNSLGSIASGIPDSAGETEVRDTYIYKPLMNNFIFSSKTGGTYVGILDYLADFDREYQDYVAQIPDPLPIGYPADSIIAFLEQQTAALDASASRETYVPVYWDNMCSLAKVGALQPLDESMVKLADKLEVANNVSWVTTITSIGAVLGGAGLKIAGVVGAPITIGGSTVVLIPSEAVLWGGVANLMLISDIIGGISGVDGLTIQGAMTSVSYEAVWQLANDLELRHAIFRSSADWLVSPTGSSVNTAEGFLTEGANPLEVVSISVHDLTVVPDQTIAQGTGQVLVKNNGSLTLNVEVHGSVTAELDDAMPTIGLVGSSSVAIAPGGQQTLSFSYQLLRSTLVHHTGYDLHLFIMGANASGITDLLGPYVAHIYVGTASQLATLDNQIFTVLQQGDLQSGQWMAQTVTFTGGTQEASLLLSFVEGSDFDLHLYDADGNHVGVNYGTGQIENQIAGVRYSGANVWPEWIAISNPGSGNYQVKVVAQNSATGSGYNLSKLEVPSLAAILDAPTQVQWSVTRLPQTPLVSETFALQIAEGGGSQSITNLQVTSSNLVGGNNATIPASSFVCSAPSVISAGGSIMGSCVLTVTSQIPAGTYTGSIQITGMDAGSNTQVVTTQMVISLAEPWWKIYLPLTIK